MKRLFYFTLTCSSLLAVLIACSNDNSPEQDGNRRDPGVEAGKIYTVSLSLGGDYVEVSDESLTKTETGSKYIGINVTRRPVQSDGTTASSEQYAHGVFVKDEISIDLVSGYLYSFEASILKDGDDEYRTQSNNYPEPFRIDVYGKPSATGANYSAGNVNKFVYFDDKNTYYLNMLASGSAYVSFGSTTTKMLAVYDYPRVHRYYGTLTDFNPSSSQSAINIEMKYKSFGLKVVAESIPEGTSVTWKDINENPNIGYTTLCFPAEAKLSKTGDSWESIYSLNDLTKDESKEMTLQFTWDRGANDIEIFSQTITFKAKQKKVLKINITGSANTTKTGNITFTYDSEELSEDVISVNHTGSNN